MDKWYGLLKKILKKVRNRNIHYPYCRPHHPKEKGQWCLSTNLDFNIIKE